MDYKFPNRKGLNKRICFNCRNRISFGDFYIRNRNVDEERLIQLWQSDHIEFYCCLCYDTMKKTDELNQIKKEMKKIDKEVLNLLEAYLGFQIPIVSQINYNTLGCEIRNGKITGLGLFRCGLTALPNEISRLSSLRVVNLAWNCFGIFPKSLCSINTLNNIDLIGNRIESIPDAISNLKNLIIIDLSFNKIQKFTPSLLKLPSLKSLKLIHNPIMISKEILRKLENQNVKVLL
ncbi:MAG: hypothetical protein GF383_03235 [Candidatus Lokiarchaeota archaeon]|nr:hypothetical protein [Candidatus Lokiarchaeota archaeon]MBD3338628.1 hypothetical protein [Candidatus Lokiarchaeota archaeon]